jgi:hypothetical protein
VVDRSFAPQNSWPGAIAYCVPDFRPTAFGKSILRHFFTGLGYKRAPILDCPAPRASPISSSPLSQLTEHSTLADLPGHDYRVSPFTLGSAVAAAFDQHPELPWVIVGEPGDEPALISRTGFFRQMSRLFSLEIYHKRSIHVPNSR